MSQIANGIDYGKEMKETKLQKKELHKMAKLLKNRIHKLTCKDTKIKQKMRKDPIKAQKRIQNKKNFLQKKI